LINLFRDDPINVFVTYSAVFGALSDFGSASVAVIRDTDYPTCSNESIFRNANTHGDLDFAGLFVVDPSSPTYAQDVEDLLSDLQATGVESIFGCSYDTLCSLVRRVAVRIYLLACLLLRGL
jgi:hypothetical protein